MQWGLGQLEVITNSRLRTQVWTGKGLYPLPRNQPVVLLLSLGLVPPLHGSDRYRALLTGSGHVAISGKISGLPDVKVRLIVLDEATVVISRSVLTGFSGTGVDRISAVMVPGTSFPFISSSIFLQKNQVNQNSILYGSNCLAAVL